MENQLTAYSSKEKRALISLVILIIALPLTVFLVKTVQNLRSKAKIAGGPVKLLLASGSQTIYPGQDFSVDLYMDTTGKTVSAYEAYLNYPLNLIDVIETTLEGNKFPVILKNTSGDGNIDLAAGITLPGTTPSITPTSVQLPTATGPMTPTATIIQPTATPTTYQGNVTCHKIITGHVEACMVLGCGSQEVNETRDECLPQNECTVNACVTKAKQDAEAAAADYGATIDWTKSYLNCQISTTSPCQ